MDALPKIIQTCPILQNTLNLNDITPSCVGDMAIIDAGTGFDTYLWSTGDTTQFLLVNTPTLGQTTYYLTVTTSTGCEFTDSTIVDVVAPNTWLGNDTSISSNENVTLYPGNYFDYLWSSSSTSPQYVFDGSVGLGTYTVWVQTTDYYGCVSSDTIIITVDSLVIDIEDINANNVQIYPNPTTGLIRIQNSEHSIKNVSVFDIYGREVLKQEVGSQKTDVDLSQQAKGIYIIKVRTERGVAVEKIVLE